MSVRAIQISSSMLRRFHTARVLSAAAEAAKSANKAIPAKGSSKIISAFISAIRTRRFAQAWQEWPKVSQSYQSLTPKDAADILDTLQSVKHHRALTAAMEVMQKLKETSADDAIVVPAQLKLFRVAVNGGHFDNAQNILSEVEGKIAEEEYRKACTLLLAGYARNRQLQPMESLLNAMKQRDFDLSERDYATVLSAYIAADHREAYERVNAERAEKGIPLSAQAYRTVMDACRDVNTDLAISLLSEMPENGVMPTGIHYSAVVYMLARDGRVDEALAVRAEASKQFKQLSHVASGHLVRALTDVDRIPEAQSILAAVVNVPDTETLDLTRVKSTLPVYVAAISLHVKKGECVEAERLFRKLHDEGYELSPFVYRAWTELHAIHNPNPVKLLAVLRQFTESSSIASRIEQLTPETPLALNTLQPFVTALKGGLNEAVIDDVLREWIFVSQRCAEKGVTEWPQEITAAAIEAYTACNSLEKANRLKDHQKQQ